MKDCLQKGKQEKRERRERRTKEEKQRTKKARARRAPMRREQVLVEDAVRLGQHIGLAHRVRVLAQNEKRLAKQAAARALHTNDPFLRAL